MTDKLTAAVAVLGTIPVWNSEVWGTALKLYFATAEDARSAYRLLADAAFMPTSPDELGDSHVISIPL